MTWRGGEGRRGTAGPSNIKVGLIALALIGLHLRAPFMLGDTAFLPYGVWMIAALGLGLLNTRSVSRSLLKRIFLFSALVALSAAPAPSFDEFLIDRLRGFAYLLAAIVSAMVVAAELRRWPASSQARLWGVAVVALLFIAVLEFLGPLKEVSDTFREAIYQNSYGADSRDVALHGAIRPNAFTAEPSWLSGTFSLVLVLWLSATTRVAKWPLFAVFLVTMTLVGRSPIILVGFVGGLVLFYDEVRTRKLQVTRTVRVDRPLGLVVLLFVGLLGTGLFSQALASRIGVMSPGLDESVILRVMAAARVSAAVLS